MRKLAAFAAVCSVWALQPIAPAYGEEEQPPDTSAAEEVPAGPDQEVYCDDGVDDDGDGDLDCDDYDCLEDPACAGEAEDGSEEGEGDEGDEGDEGEDEGETTPPTGPRGAGRPTSPAAEEEDDLLPVEEDEDEQGGGWGDRPLDMFEIHGYLRVRADLFHMLHMHHVRGGLQGIADYEEGYLARTGAPSPYPYRPIGNAQVACGEDDGTCDFYNNTLAGANMRFRLEPIINLGDQVRILAQVDLLDNLVLGSTPEGAYYEPSGVGGRSPWVPLRFFGTTQVSPTGRNSLTEAISVRRVWAEVTTPFGQLHFGRMGSHWGLGMFHNDGNRLDDDYGDTVDRIFLSTRLWGILFSPGVEFVDQGPTTGLWGESQGQALDAGQLDDVAQYFLVVARQLPREEQEDRLRRGDLVLNGGLYLTFRNQVLSQERVGAWSAAGEEASSPLTLRNAWALIPDLWFQLYYRSFHLELELAYIGGQVENTSPEGYDAESDVEVRQFGGVLRGDYTALNGQLNVGLELGYASGDAEIEGLTPMQAHQRLVQRRGFAGSAVDSMFRFDPDFNVDLILFEQVLGQVSGAYYVRPWVSYEFIRNTIGVRVDLVYSLAAEPLQTIGNDLNLGVEIDAAVWYRAPAPHNFYALLQYGVLFPLAAWEDPFGAEFDRIDYPQTVQAMLAVPY